MHVGNLAEQNRARLHESKNQRRKGLLEIIEDRKHREIIATKYLHEREKVFAEYMDEADKAWSKFYQAGLKRIGDQD